MLEPNEIQQALQNHGYNVIECIGKGGFGYVFRCAPRSTHSATAPSSLSEEVAIKVLDKKRMNRAGLKKRVIQEVEIHSSLSHDNIVRFYSAWEDKMAVYVMMEYCPMGDLYSWISNHGACEDSSCRHIIKQIVEAIQYLHSKKIMHRDLKLSNILIRKASREGELGSQSSIALCDFGLAVKLDPEGEEHFTRCGTPFYVAPEVDNSSQPHSLSADMWSCGCLLYMIKFAKSPISRRGKPNATRNLRRRGTVSTGKSKDHDKKVVEVVFSRTFSTNLEDRNLCSEDCKNLILGLLQLDPKKRLSAAAAMRHPYVCGRHAWCDGHGYDKNHSSRGPHANTYGRTQTAVSYLGNKYFNSGQTRETQNQDLHITKAAAFYSSEEDMEMACTPKKDTSVNCSNPRECSMQLDIPKALSASSSSDVEATTSKSANNGSGPPKRSSVSVKKNCIQQNVRQGCRDMKESDFNFHSDNQRATDGSFKCYSRMDPTVDDGRKLLAQAYDVSYFSMGCSQEEQSRSRVIPESSLITSGSLSKILEIMRTEYLPAFNHVTSRALISINCDIQYCPTKRDDSISVDSFFFATQLRFTVYESSGAMWVNVRKLDLRRDKVTKMKQLTEKLNDSNDSFSSENSRSFIWKEFCHLLQDNLEDPFGSSSTSFSLESLPEKFKSYYVYLFNSVKVLSVGHPTIKMFSPHCTTTLMANFPQPDCHVRFSKRVEIIYSMKFGYCVVQVRDLGALILWISPRSEFISTGRLALAEKLGPCGEGMYIQIRNDAGVKTPVFDTQFARKWILTSFYFVRSSSTRRKTTQSYEIQELPSSLKYLTSLVAFVQEKTNKSLSFLEKLEGLHKRQGTTGNSDLKRYACIREKSAEKLPAEVHNALNMLCAVPSKDLYLSAKNPWTTTRISDQVTQVTQSTVGVQTNSDPSALTSTLCTSVMREQLQSDSDILKVGRTRSGKLCIVFSDSSKIVINKQKETVQFIQKPDYSNMSEMDNRTASTNEMTTFVTGSSPPRSVGPNTAYFMEEYSFSCYESSEKQATSSIIPQYVQQRLLAARAYMKSSKSRVRSGR